jgi:hypothetical protein
MNTQIIKSFIFMALSLSALGCQSQQTTAIVDTKKASEQPPIISTSLPPCKNYSSPLIKDKTKLKDMLFKEGKLNNNMTDEEISTYLNEFIKKKSTRPCKPIFKKAVVFSLPESIRYA